MKRNSVSTVGMRVRKTEHRTRDRSKFVEMNSTQAMQYLTQIFSDFTEAAQGGARTHGDCLSIIDAVYRDLFDWSNYNDPDFNRVELP